MPEAHAQPGLEYWLEAGSGTMSWRAALEHSAKLLGARAIAFGIVGGAGDTRLLGLFPNDEFMTPVVANGFLARAENEQTGYLRSEIASATIASETITIWLVALLDRSSATRLLREVAQAAAHAAMRATQASMTPAEVTGLARDLTEAEIRLARSVLHDGAQRRLH